MSLWTRLFGEGQSARSTKEPSKPSTTEGKQGPLETAIQKGDLVEVKALLDQGADVNALGSKGSAPIHSARSPEMLELLISHGASVNARYGEGTTALHLCAYSERTIGMEKAGILLANGADVNAVGSRKTTPLHEAASQGNAELVELLLKSGATPNLQDDSKRTPIHQAVDKNFQRIVEILLSYGADTDTTDFLDDSPLATAAHKGYIEIAKLLMKNSHSIGVGGCKALNNAVTYGEVEMLRLLVRGGADVNATDGVFTPLMIAVTMQKLEMVEILLEGGAIPNVMMASMAANSGCPEISSLLLDFTVGNRKPHPAGPGSSETQAATVLNEETESLQPVIEVSIPSYYGKHLYSWDALEPKVKLALRNIPKTNQQESKESLANAVAFDLQDHSEVSLNQIARLQMKMMDDAFKKVVQGNDASFGLFSIMRSRHLANSYYWFARLLREQPDTALLETVRGNMGILSFMDLAHLVKQSEMEPNTANMSDRNGILGYYWRMDIDGSYEDGRALEAEDKEAGEKARWAISTVSDMRDRRSFLFWNVERHIDAAVKAATPTHHDLIPIWEGVRNHARQLLN